MTQNRSTSPKADSKKGSYYTTVDSSDILWQLKQFGPKHRPRSVDAKANGDVTVATEDLRLRAVALIDSLQDDDMRVSSHKPSNKAETRRVGIIELVEEEGETSSPLSEDQSSITASSLQAVPLPKLQTLLIDLLTQVVKPLFSTVQHPSLTTSGRKKVYTDSIPQLDRFSVDFLDDEGKPWRNRWTIPLLTWILECFDSFRFAEYRDGLVKKTALQHENESLPAPGKLLLSQSTSVTSPTETSSTSHSQSTTPILMLRTLIKSSIYLLTPPLLQLIDTSFTQSKTAGAQLLYKLSQMIRLADSDVLVRTGLAEAFLEALKPNLLMLPPLTPEEESALLLGPTYDAYIMTAEAAYGKVAAAATPKDPFHNPIPLEAHLLYLLRHALFPSLKNLSSHSTLFSAIATTSSPPVTLQLLKTLSALMHSLNAVLTNIVVRHLREMLEIYHGAISDPFLRVTERHLWDAATSGLDNLYKFAIEKGNSSLLSTRLRDTYWLATLRRLVSCWVNIEDDVEGVNADAGRKQKLHRDWATKDREFCTAQVSSLRKVVDAQEMDAVVRRLVEKQPGLKLLLQESKGEEQNRTQDPKRDFLVDDDEGRG